MRDTGLSVGIDAGQCRIVEIAGALTIVGTTVVGAVRMVNSAIEPWETIVNVYLGEYLERALARSQVKLESVHREYRSTKEYPEGQEVYNVKFKP